MSQHTCTVCTCTYGGVFFLSKRSPKSRAPDAKHRKNGVALLMTCHGIVHEQSHTLRWSAAQHNTYLSRNSVSTNVRVLIVVSSSPRRQCSPTKSFINDLFRIPGKIPDSDSDNNDDTTTTTTQADNNIMINHHRLGQAGTQKPHHLACQKTSTTREGTKRIQQLFLQLPNIKLLQINLLHSGVSIVE